MYFLGCDTSTLQGEVALFKNDNLLYKKSWFRHGSHSDVINEAIQNCLDSENLKLENIHVYCTGIGPGSFTGIRIAYNSMKTWGAFFNKPVIGINSLINIANANRNCLSKSNAEEVLVIINAFKNMVYAEKFKIKKNDNKTIELISIFPPSVIRVQEISKSINNNTILIGDGYLNYQNYLSNQVNFPLLRLDNGIDYCSAESLVQLAYQQFLLNPERFKNFDWNQNLPLYLRASEAEENLNGIKYKSL